MLKSVLTPQMRRELSLSLLVVLSFAVLALTVRTGSAAVQTFAAILAGVAAVLAIDTIGEDEPQVRVVRVTPVRRVRLRLHASPQRRSVGHSYGQEV